MDTPDSPKRKTPRPIPRREFVYEMPEVIEGSEMKLNGSAASIWRAIAMALGGLLLGMTTAWWTAWQQKGVTQEKMEAYVRDYSPYMMDKQLLADHNRSQDETIGIIRGKQERVIERLALIEQQEKLDEQDRSSMHTKMDIVAKMLEDQQKLKR